jgi:hypothetical protein
MKALSLPRLMLMGCLCIASSLATVLEYPSPAAAESPALPNASPSLRWEWVGAGRFPPEFSLTIQSAPGGNSFAILDELGPLESKPGWGELQRSHTTHFARIRQVGEKHFLVFAELRRAAEIAIAVDGALKLAWFSLTEQAPSDDALAKGRLETAFHDFPEEMRPSWTPAPRTPSADPI